MSVSIHEPCGQPVYVLSGPDGEQRVLDTVDHYAGQWLPEPDGRTCRPVTDADLYDDIDGSRSPGYRLHECPPAEQEALFEAGEVGVSLCVTDTVRHRATYPGRMSAPCDCGAGADHEAVLRPPAPLPLRPAAAWTGRFAEHSALVCEFSQIRATAWDSPGHMPWVTVSQTPCPDVDGGETQHANYQCRLRHVHWDAVAGQDWRGSV